MMSYPTQDFSDMKCETPQQAQHFDNEDDEKIDVGLMSDTYLIQKSIYGLKQASRQWYIKFNDIITSFAFKENVVDKCIYLKISRSKFIILFLSLNNILHASSDLGLLCNTKEYLTKNFEMKDVGEASFVLGVEIFRDRSRSLLELS